MDGNGRWAKARGKPTIAGHRAGAETARRITERAAQLGVKYLTLYTFSSENWLRQKSWVDDLMGLIRWYLKNELKSLLKNGVRLRVIGQRDLLPPDIQTLIEQAEKQTEDNSTITVILALSYGSRQELTQAAKSIAHKIAEGTLHADDVTPEIVEQHLYTAGIPDPDLLIRTSGELRLSNYLLWQMAYTEFVFSQTLWPDFTTDEFDQALETYHRRQRRYGL
ncbi:di-trans,poly-cis-decaprenylcistransferase [Candidatus Finniella inopinata]|uniref:Isoprenyl transferase n=2 Tax=Candidatus Finniella inopinata TaxID=1696036 RepID=A0A4Q7DHS5_9PROT|nr:di-trans,poly-cis-decaprenylcistransferase [Candidatus Finniella inopinata]